MGRKGVVFFCICVIGCFVGVVCHGYFGFQKTLSGLCETHLVALWLASLSLFFSIQGVVNTLAPYFHQPTMLGRQTKSRCTYWSSVTYYLVGTVLSLIIVVGYSIGKRVDGTSWAAFLSLITMMNFLAIKKVQTKEKEGESYAKGNKKSLRIPFQVHTQNIDEVGRYEKDSFDISERDSDSEQHQSEDEGQIFFDKDSQVWFLMVQTIRGTNIILKGISFLLLVLLANGALLNGSNRYMYPPRGRFVDVTLSQGTLSQFHVICEGKQDKNLPVIWLEVSGNHHLEEFKGIRDELIQSNRRYCIYDPLGEGYSSSSPIQQVEYYEELMQSLEDKGPFIMMGWAGGGTVMYSYALKHPENVLAIAFLDSYPGGYEWDYLQLDEGLTDEQVEIRRTQEIQRRIGLLNLLRGLAAPWGITPFFFPTPISFVPAEHAEESNHHVLLDRTWNTQYYLLKEILVNGDDNPFEDVNINKSIEILTIVSVPSSFRNESAYCGERGIPSGSAECAHEMKMAEYGYEARTQLTKRVPRGYVVHCVDCSFGFPTQNPDFVVKTMINTFAHVRKPSSNTSIKK